MSPLHYLSIVRPTAAARTWVVHVQHVLCQPDLELGLNTALIVVHPMTEVLHQAPIGGLAAGAVLAGHLTCRQYGNAGSTVQYSK